MSRPNSGPFKRTHPPRGPQPTLYGAKAQPEGHVTVNGQGASWWLGVPREDWQAALKERERTSWGPFSGRALSFAPDKFEGWGQREHSVAPWDVTPAPPKTLRAPQ